MKKKIKYIIFFLSFGTPFLGASQENALRNDAIQQRIEFIAQQFESSTIDYSNLIEILTYYFNNPLNINTATQEELESLNLLSPFQIRALITHRIKNGDLLTLYELRNFNGFDFVSIQNLVPFVSVSPSSNADNLNIKRALKYGTHEVMSLWGQTLEDQAGYAPRDNNTSENARYMGDPNRLYLRYKFRYSTKLSFGVTMEKDPGEEFFKSSNKNGFDFYSAHLFATNLGIIKQVAIGDYHAQFGQGLTFWSGFSYGKTADVMNVVKYGRKLSGYSSRNENAFLRGAGTTVKIKDFEVTGFYSKKKLDANLVDQDTLTSEEQVFSSIQESGLHRTPGEIRDKNSISEEIIGANVDWSKNAVKLGARMVQSRYKGSFNRDLQTYQKFQLDTNQWYNAGIDANILLKHVNFFGEASMSNNRGWAYIAGALLKLDDRLNVSIINRNYQPNYLSIHSNAFGEKTDNNNEKGIYVGVKADVLPGVVLTGYVDKYQFNWLSYQADGPANGLDYMMRLQWQISRYFSVYTRFRKESQQKNSSDDQPISSLSTRSKSYLRFHLTYKASNTLKFNSRVELSNAQDPGSETGKGFVIYQDFQVKFMESKSTLTGRVALFDVNDYDARIYAYENDVLYYFSVPAFNNRGARGYLVWHYKPMKKFEIWAKVARTFISNQTTMGSGTELIDAPHKTEVRVQVRFKF